MRVDLLLRHARQLLTLDGPPPDPRDPHASACLGVLEDGAVACAEGRVVAVGRTDDVERAVDRTDTTRVIDVGDALVAPGLIDAHTHALYVGHRADEFAARLRGESYASIAGRGGGIARSVRDLRATSEAQLSSILAARLERMRAYGVTTVEVKTGYGLDTASELRSLRAIRAAARDGGPRALATFLPLHAVDPALRDASGGRTSFLQRTMDETVPAVLAERPDFVDAYVDSTGFSVAETRPLLERAAAAGIPCRLHIGQFADIGGAELAATLGAASADHLEHVSDAGLQAMAAAGVVAILLPGAAFSLGQHFPDARRMRAFGLDVALATDCNPGTSCTENLPLMAAFGVRMMGLSIPEAWWALTRAPARSLRRQDAGRIAVGAPADIAVLDLPDWQALPYAFGGVIARATVIGGVFRSTHRGGA